eukprot:CAMPEP_0119369094 /NCGR_PEP_ID=MMETSP1334-20130426/15665_1 /TAXON_ID=127549 /ORGANISM="Calcidiscus leptoporus, Strain RCC1130" /LENGTH=203 /DNA_ID=CAMNT_0007385877 /DNA_START=340 /DNA_END=951 /DNA_ORIENTATION=-
MLTHQLLQRPLSPQPAHKCRPIRRSQAIVGGVLAADERPVELRAHVKACASQCHLLLAPAARAAAGRKKAAKPSLANVRRDMHALPECDRGRLHRAHQMRAQHQVCRHVLPREPALRLLCLPPPLLGDHRIALAEEEFPVPSRVVLRLCMAHQDQLDRRACAGLQRRCAAIVVAERLHAEEAQQQERRKRAEEKHEDGELANA